MVWLLITIGIIAYFWRFGLIRGVLIIGVLMFAVAAFNASDMNPIACSVGDRDTMARITNCNHHLPDPVRQDRLFS